MLFSRSPFSFTEFEPMKNLQPSRIQFTLTPLALALIAFCVSPCSLNAEDLATAEPPNVILVFIDDMGWGDFSCFGNQSVETENIDRLAKEGIRFEQFYVNSPICSPSRVAISTGQ